MLLGKRRFIFYRYTTINFFNNCSQAKSRTNKTNPSSPGKMFISAVRAQASTIWLYIVSFQGRLNKMFSFKVAFWIQALKRIKYFLIYIIILNAFNKICYFYLCCLWKMLSFKAEVWIEVLNFGSIFISFTVSMLLRCQKLWIYYRVISGDLNSQSSAFRRLKALFKGGLSLTNQ